ncbi:MAG: DUF1425 domain-containing protein [Candidatus Omnitrophica bacterium]|nr:DUF1425 domain-containing protein [Candidatus Omnitrophota bacterium]
MGYTTKNKNYNIFKFLGLFVLIFALAEVLNGCGTAGMAGSANVVEGPNGYMQESRVVVYNNWLAHYIKITDLKSFFVGDLLKANVTVFSKALSTLNLQYKFRWYNSQSSEVESESSPWQPLILYGKETKSVQAVAPNPSVKEFKIEIRFRE